ncbi:MAG: cobalt transporter [Candidatus Faecousia sp.]|nr:cobalt transporter [Candidatus Faecousia sp.]
MHLDHDHIGAHSHEHTHADGTTHTHEHEHPHEHTPMEELTALMKYMVGHNTAHAKELADLAKKLDEAGNHTAYEQVMAAVSDFEKGNMRLSVVLSSLAE